ncbi:MAG TPA: cytochrome c-type biogenesis CcmF C-terminal domain-containing protein, partial [Ilumatobacteraceae bacterium]|nr:cytochrome c-type biogenesis CcmF C-terminal domain-containing protein [Ilumatobacteraceae bacterium]
WVGAGALVLAVAVGADGFAPLVAFFLGGFAAGSALRQVVLATRRQGFAGMLGRANGGMIVHLGVIILAVALVSANAFTRSADLSLSVGQPAAAFEGHTFALRSIDAFSDARSKGVKAHVIIDGGQAYAPALTTYTGMGRTIGTPSVKTGVGGDIYLTLVGSPVAGGSTAQIKVFLKPLTVWLWIGGGLMALGTVLAAFPGRRRRRPTDPVSADAVRIDPPSADESEVVGVGS